MPKVAFLSIKILRIIELDCISGRILLPLDILQTQVYKWKKIWYSLMVYLTNGNFFSLIVIFSSGLFFLKKAMHFVLLFFQSSFMQNVKLLCPLAYC